MKHCFEKKIVLKCRKLNYIYTITVKVCISNTKNINFILGIKFLLLLFTYRVATHSGKSGSSGNFQIIENQGKLREVKDLKNLKIFFTGSRIGFSKSSFNFNSKKLLLFI